MGKVTETEWTHDLASGTDDDAIQGWMTKRKNVETQDVIDNNFSKIFVVREYCEHINGGEGGDRSRIVDQFSEGDQNMATLCKRKCRVDGVDVFRQILVFCMTAMSRVLSEEYHG